MGTSAGDYQVGHYRLAWLLLLAHHGIAILVGVAGLVSAPTPSIDATLEGSGWLTTVGLGMWSGGYILFGGIGIVARLKRRIIVETFAICGVAGLRIIWSGAIIVASTTIPGPGGNLQSALSIFAGAVFMLGAAAAQVAWLHDHPKPAIIELRDQLRTALDDFDQDNRA